MGGRPERQAEHSLCELGLGHEAGAVSFLMGNAQSSTLGPRVKYVFFNTPYYESCYGYTRIRYLDETDLTRHYEVTKALPQNATLLPMWGAGTVPCAPGERGKADVTSVLKCYPCSVRHRRGQIRCRSGEDELYMTARQAQWET